MQTWLRIPGVIVVSVVIACSIAAYRPLPMSDPTSSSNSKRFLALGDSYTIGERVADNRRWPNQLISALRKAGISFDDPIIIAKTGWTTDELSSALDHANPQGTYELVSLLIGVNNQYRGRSSEEYRKEFDALLKRAIGFAANEPSHVIVVSVPDWGATPFADGRDRAKIASEIDAYNAINHEETIAAGARYIDITPISRRAFNDPNLIAEDGLHPSGAMYSEWTALMIPVVRSLFSR